MISFVRESILYPPLPLVYYIRCMGEVISWNPEMII